MRQLVNSGFRELMNNKIKTQRDVNTYVREQNQKSVDKSGKDCDRKQFINSYNRIMGDGE